MTTMLWINIPLALLFIAAVSGIPMWLIIRHPDRAPDHSDARSYLRAREELERDAAGDPAHIAAMAATVPPIPRKGRWKLGPPRGIGPGRRAGSGGPARRPGAVPSEAARRDG